MLGNIVDNIVYPLHKLHFVHACVFNICKMYNTFYFSQQLLIWLASLMLFFP